MGVRLRRRLHFEEGLSVPSRRRRLAWCSRWLRLLAPLVPASRRRDWLAEWQAELACRVDAPQSSHDHPPIGWHLARDASGALLDALWLAYEPWSSDPMLEDLRHAWRTLTRHPAFTVGAVLTLAIGIGVTTAIMAAVDVVLVRPLPYPEPDRLVALWESNPEYGSRPNNAAPANVLDWREQSVTLDDVAFRRHAPRARILDAGSKEAVRASGLAVSGNFFDVLGVAPTLGRALVWDETWETDTTGIVLDHDFWQRAFGGRTDAVGRSIRIDGLPGVVVGIMPARFETPGGKVDFWHGLAWDPGDRDALSFRSWHFLWPIARLAPGVTLPQARAELDVISRRLGTAHPDTNAHVTVGITPLHAWQTGDTRRPLLVLLGAVAIVLLIACANVANLLLVRAAQRGREMTVRRALGADRLRLSRQLFAEGLLLAVAAGAVGVISARGMVIAIKALAPEGLPRLADIAVDTRVILLAGGLALMSTLLFALAPAWIGARGGAVLRTRGDEPSSRQGNRARSVLVIAEVALALALMVGLGLLSRSLQALYEVDLGFTPDHVLAVKVELPTAMFPGSDSTSSTARRASLFAQLEADVRALPGVEALASASGLPVTGQRWLTDYAIAGRPREAFGLGVGHVNVSPGFFRTLETPLFQGRDFTSADGSNSESVIVVNETWVREAFPNGGSPLGAQVMFDRYPDAESQWFTVVGVVGDIRHENVGAPPRAMVYQSILRDHSSYRYLTIRTESDPAVLVPAIRETVQALDPALPLMEVTTFESLVTESVAMERLVTLLLAVFGLVATLLAMIGTYGTIAFVTNQRQRELAIRAAVGASRFDLTRLVIVRGLRWIGLGLLAGLALAAIGSRFLGSLLFEVGAGDPMTYAMFASLLALAGLVACWLPARRAARRDPSATLRAD